jgi:hypothetical protein
MLSSLPSLKLATDISVQHEEVMESSLADRLEEQKPSYGDFLSS